LEYKLFYERDDVYAAKRPTRRIIHNAIIIQLCLVLVIVCALGWVAVPIIYWVDGLMGQPPNLILYLVILWAITTPTYVVTSLYIRRLNKLFEESIRNNSLSRIDS
jgi:Flp pilus assembly protein TadB